MFEKVILGVIWCILVLVMISILHVCYKMFNLTTQCKFIQFSYICVSIHNESSFHIIPEMSMKTFNPFSFSHLSFARIKMVSISHTIYVCIAGTALVRSALIQSTKNSNKKSDTYILRSLRDKGWTYFYSDMAGKKYIYFRLIIGGPLRILCIWNQCPFTWGFGLISYYNSELFVHTCDETGYLVTYKRYFGSI